MQLHFHLSRGSNRCAAAIRVDTLSFHKANSLAKARIHGPVVINVMACAATAIVKVFGYAFNLPRRAGQRRSCALPGFPAALQDGLVKSVGIMRAVTSTDSRFFRSKLSGVL